MFWSVCREVKFPGVVLATSYMYGPAVIAVLVHGCGCVSIRIVTKVTYAASCEKTDGILAWKFLHWITF